jgi:DNA mismatch endonuclease (patch repair protein)
VKNPVVDTYPHPSSRAASAVMKANRSSDTLPELRLRSLLHRQGHRFRACLRIETAGVRVRPDIVFSRQRVAVFVDGCFWHSCAVHGNVPRSNSAYWISKLSRVVERDRRNDAALEIAGWKVVRVWEHVSPADAAALVQAAVVESTHGP